MNTFTQQITATITDNQNPCKAMTYKNQVKFAQSIINLFVSLLCVVVASQLIIAVITGLLVASLIVLSLIFVSVVAEAINNPVYTQD